MKNKELKKMRVDMGVSQQDVAQAIGVGISTYSVIENGSRMGSVETWIKLQKYFNIKDEDMWALYLNKQKGE